MIEDVFNVSKGISPTIDAVFEYMKYIMLGLVCV